MVLVALALLVAGAYAFDRLIDDDESCAALAAPVASFGGFSWDNGITSSGSEWISVLTDGVIHADEADRARIAVAVQADEDGFDQFRGSLPEDLRPTADRLHALALDPDEAFRRRSDRSVERDVSAISRHGLLTCNLA